MKRTFFIMVTALGITLTAFVLLSSRFGGVTGMANSVPEPASEKPRKTLRAFGSAQGIDLPLYPQLTGEPAGERGIDAGRQLPDGEGAGVHRATTVPGGDVRPF